MVYPVQPLLPKRKPSNPPALTAAEQFNTLATANLTQTLSAKNTDFKKQKDISDKARTELVKLEKDIAKQYAILQNDPTNAAALAALSIDQQAKTKQQTTFDNAAKKMKELVADIAALQQALKPAKTVIPPKNTGSVPTITGDGGAKPPFLYKYNAPMVKSAYFNPFGPQATSVNDSSTMVGSGTYKDGRNAWQTGQDGNSSGSKGVIQMSQYFAQTVKITEAAKKNPNFDMSMYGFKFLYNPNTIMMSWGTITDVNPQLEAMGLDKSVSLTSALSSTISFELLLNRIGDMAFVDEFGLKGKTTTETNGTNYFTHRVPNFNVTDIYPQEVNNEELALIYKKGTMYDFDYLFRTINGFSSSYKSGLNGKTADWGWLYAYPVELHLGDGLRYLVRISSLDIEHKMFNERMVPIFSNVRITCARYPDIASQQTTKK